MDAQAELARRIQGFGHEDWTPAFGKEMYTEVLYVDSGGNRYSIAPIEEAQNLLDADLQARIEVSVGIVTPEPISAPDNDANEHQTETALPVVDAPTDVAQPEQEATNGG